MVRSKQPGSFPESGAEETRTEVDAEAIWQRVRAFSAEAHRTQTPVKTLQTGTVNYITEVGESKISRRSALGKTNAARPVPRSQIVKIWVALVRDEHPPRALSFSRALLEAALPEVTHIDGVLQLSERRSPTSFEVQSPRTVELEAHRVSKFSVKTRAQLRTATRREGELVVAYQEHLAGHAVVQQRRYYDDLQNDVFIAERGHLIEAKADVSRESIRMAIGQLFDYRQLEDQPVDLGILVPEKPPADLLALLAALEIACIWQVAGGFNDTRGGTFC